MSEKEREILDNIKRTIPLLRTHELDRLAAFAEGMAQMAEMVTYGAQAH